MHIVFVSAIKRSDYNLFHLAKTSALLHMRDVKYSRDPAAVLASFTYNVALFVKAA